VRIVSKFDEFRHNADECLRMAERTANENDRGAWLRLAEAWLRMIRPGRAESEERHTPAEDFRAQERAQGTGQKPSMGSH
jgi:hypothetical protein